MGTAAVDGGELVQCVQRWLTFMGEEEEQAGLERRGYRECWL